ncbi:hypothetical protein SAMN04487950_3609 [Halogranum rubrum]|uniref:Uncharacterized protein n=1 Tax=Halogranum rubrum TaxID=553466 RepID=A0A1I4HAL4_9EURY|nr:hypothetical protein SAMN04487950_3609 [Halogranum rubrum]
MIFLSDADTAERCDWKITSTRTHNRSEVGLFEPPQTQEWR